MATTKFYLDRRNPRKDGTAPLKLSVADKGKTALIGLDVLLTPEQWDAMAGKIIGRPDKAALNTYILKRKLDVETALLELSSDGRIRSMSISDIKRYLTGKTEQEKAPTEGSFARGFRKFSSMKTNPRTKEIYEATISRLRKFAGEGFEKLDFEDVTREWLASFDTFLSRTSPSRNARNIHLRNIRAVFNEAIDDGVTTWYPFRKFKIKGERTAKRSLSVEQLRAFLSYPAEPGPERYRDMFKLSFLLMGINIVDMAGLRDGDLRDGRICYHRAKTGRLYDIKAEPEAMEIIGRHRGSGHLLDILDRYTDYRDYARRLNENLRRIGPFSREGQGGRKTYSPLFPGITTYWARHSWATIAASLDIPKETIAHALGHGCDTVTDIYIDFDMKKVDEANRRVMDWVLYGKR